MASQTFELGPFANETRMPNGLWNLLSQGPRLTPLYYNMPDGLYLYHMAENETLGIVPFLTRMSELDPSVQYGFYGHPATKHIGRLPGEDGFCGYRNILMLMSYIQGARAPGWRVLPPAGHTSGIPELQDMIEDAWDLGIGDVSRAQIGRLKGTRKWIGTTEVRFILT